ncbi:hypothetical protein ACVIGB_000376 [Bradyrhizobium sp. USDA 4341]
MTKTVTIPARFIYQAEVLPARHRVSKRAHIAEKIEFTLAAPAPGNYEFDAVIVEPRPGKDAAFHFAGWNGRLWRRAEAPFSTLETYRSTFADLDKFLKDDDPKVDPVIMAALKGANQFGTLPLHGQIIKAEEFDGEISSSNREQMLARQQEATRHIVSLDGVIHHAAHDPIWYAIDGGEQAELQIMLPVHNAHHGQIHLRDGGPHCYNNLSSRTAFRLDRLDEAREWLTMTRPGAAVSVSGSVKRLDDRYLSRNDLGYELREHLRGSIPSGELLSHLPPIAGASWKAVQDAVATVTPYDNGALDTDQDNLLQHVRTLGQAVEALFPPAHLVDQRVSTLAAIDRLLRRAEFEQAKALHAARDMLAGLADISWAPQV